MAVRAAWLYERLVSRFGRKAVFKDVDSIDLGDDFRETISNAVGSCDVLLAMIGREWATITDAAGCYRLDDPNDFVRLEIETALQRKVRVIPILVEGAALPRAEQLPVSLAKLVHLQALELSPNRFEYDTTRLLRVVETTITQDVALAEIRSGDCLQTPAAYINNKSSQVHFWRDVPWPAEIGVVPCERSHGGEAFFVGDLWEADASYPGDEAIQEQSDQRCQSELEAYTGQPLEESGLSYTMWFPDADSWASGRRQIGCVAYDPSGADLKGSIRYSGRSVRSPLINDNLKDDH